MVRLTLGLSRQNFVLYQVGHVFAVYSTVEKLSGDNELGTFLYIKRLLWIFGGIVVKPLQSFHALVVSVEICRRQGLHHNFIVLVAKLNILQDWTANL